MKRWSVRDLLNWRRYALLLLGTLPLSAALVLLDATVGGFPWTFYGTYAVYCIAGMWWCLR